MVLVSDSYYDNHFRKKNVILCANCGGIGHIYKSCNHPIISYGVICYQMFYDQQTNSIYPKYLMVQRKDSLSYVEFIRGKYEIQNRLYLLRLFSFMTTIERERIRNNDFDNLWKDMWCKHTDQENNKNFTREFSDATIKFNMLKNGFYIKTDQGNIFINLEVILNNTKAEYEDTEWGFPKGRRNINEDDISCAVREFREETGIQPRNIRLCADIKPCEEVFSGTNKVRYKHVYYISKYINTVNSMDLLSSNEDHLFDPLNKQQCKEIKDVQWFSYTDAQLRIRNQNVERKELLKRINSVILKLSF
jgi:8-oxo-dGTP pyrophosphatase MutT (NUDIX family)